jgi:signal transduction histidine kinase
MSLVETGDAPSSRTRVFRVFLNQGIAGLVLMVVLTWLRREEPGTILREIGSGSELLVLALFGFSLILAFLKFPLTEQIFVSLAITAFIAMIPLLGLVLSAWIAVTAAIVNRLFDMAGIGPTKVMTDDLPLETVRTFGLFGTYGIPVTVAALCFEWLGGRFPVQEISGANAARIALAGTVLVVINNLIMMRAQRAYGYPTLVRLKLAALDSSIYILTIPYAIITTLAWTVAGLWGLVLSGFTGILANWVGRKLAFARYANEDLVRRLSSLTNIGKTISLSFTTDQLLQAIHTECRRVVDTTLFSIALYDEERRELRFELNACEGEYQGRATIELGEGLNSWVVENRKSLMLSTLDEERAMGLSSVDDGIPSESWLGVPMMVRDRVIGVISVQSYKRYAFTEDDRILLTAVANQAAAALVNARLYHDLERLNARLERRVEERTMELRDANLKLLAADRSKNQFLANMSHELRTPLNSIIGFSTLLLGRTESMLPPRLHGFVENIRVAGVHLLGLINDILDLSRIVAGKMELRTELFDLRDTIASVDRVMKGAASERSISIVSNVDSDVPEIRADEGRIKQVLLNLLSNAVKFSPPGSFVYLNAGLSGGEAGPTRRVRIEVIDHGIGIEPGQIDRIFDEFYQADAASRGARGGTGLGLSLTRSFVELHGGTVSVHSVPGSGSTFTVDVPIEPLESSRDASPSGAVKARGQKTAR